MLSVFTNEIAIIAQTTKLIPCRIIYRAWLDPSRTWTVKPWDGAWEQNMLVLSPIIPALFSAWKDPYYSQNYAGILGAGLSNSHVFIGCNRIKCLQQYFMLQHKCLTIENFYLVCGRVYMNFIAFSDHLDISHILFLVSPLWLSVLQWLLHIYCTC